MKTFFVLLSSWELCCTMSSRYYLLNFTSCKLHDGIKLDNKAIKAYFANYKITNRQVHVKVVMHSWATSRTFGKTQFRNLFSFEVSRDQLSRSELWSFVYIFRGWKQFATKIVNPPKFYEPSSRNKCESCRSWKSHEIEKLYLLNFYW